MVLQVSMNLSLLCFINNDSNVLNMFIDIQTSKKLIQTDTDKMLTNGTITMNGEKLTVIIKHNRNGSLDKYSINQTF